MPRLDFKSLSIIAGALVVLGALAPWSTGAIDSASGIAGDGQWTAGLAAFGCLVILVQEAGKPSFLRVSIGCAIVCLVVAVANVERLNNATVYLAGREYHPASVGWGLWLTLIAAAGMAVCAFYYRREALAAATKPPQGSSEAAGRPE